MAKLSEFAKVQNPISGKEFSLFDIGALISLVLGGVVLIAATAAIQNIAKKVEDKLRVDMTVDPLTKAATTPVAGKLRV